MFWCAGGAERQRFFWILNKPQTALEFNILLPVFKLKSDRKNNKQALQPKWSTAVRNSIASFSYQEEFALTTWSG